MAKEFFEGTDIPWAIFHTFRREAGSVPLKQQDAGSETENQDDELDEALTGMDYIPYTQQNAEAFFAQLEQWKDVYKRQLFPGTDPAKLSFTEMVDFLRLKRFGSLIDSEMNQQVFILDLSFNPEITDELMVIYFDLNKEIFCITHES